jgi:FkbM family methyltransferase
MNHIKTRAGTYDDAIVKEMKVYDPLFAGNKKKRRVVLDVGGNIGAFAVRACRIHEAHLVYSYEPDPENYKLLCENTRNYKVVTFNKAVTNFDAHFTELYINSGMNKATHSIICTRGRNSIIVDAISLRKVLKLSRATHVKIDIEGYEYEFELLRSLPLHVQAVAVELHLNRKKWREQDAPELIASLTDQFPDVQNKPVVGPKNWTTMFIGTR